MRILFYFPLLVFPALVQAEWLGGQGTVEKINTILSSDRAKDEKPTDDPLADKLAVFEQSGKTTATSEEWMGLLRLWMKSAPALTDDYLAAERRNVQLTEIFDLLPPPSEWKTLRENLLTTAAPEDKMVNAMMNGIESSLSGDAETVASAAENFEKFLDSRDFYTLQKLREFLVEIAETPEQIVAGVRIILDAAKREASRGGGYLSLPALLPGISEEQARPLLHDLLKTPGLRWRAPNAATRKFAQQVALEMISELTEAPWQLVDGSEVGQNLYDALVAKFGEIFEDQEFVAAYNIRILHLVIHSKSDEALAMYQVLVEKSPQDNNALQQILSYFSYGGSSAVELNSAFEFLENISRTSKPTDIDFWDSYGNGEGSVRAFDQNKERLPTGDQGWEMNAKE